MVIKPIRQDRGRETFQIAGIRAGWALLSAGMACQNVLARQWEGLTVLFVFLSGVFVLAFLRAMQRGRRERRAARSSFSQPEPL